MKKIVIGGGTGLIGKALSKALSQKGYKVVHLSRNKKNKSEYKTYTWDPEKGTIDPLAFENAYAIIQLAGAGIADHRWTQHRKKIIINSRVKSSQLIFNTLTNQKNPSLKILISASAIGYYGNSGPISVNEKNKMGNGFLSKSTAEWENAIEKWNELDTRNATIRIGIVLSTEGGALSKMLQTRQFGVIGFFGDGQNYFSWIHVNDLVNLLIHTLENPEVRGVYNATAPYPITSKQLAEAIVIHPKMRSITIPIPAFLLRIILGEMADTVLVSTKVSSKKIQNTGFKFRFPEIHIALKDLFK